MAFDVGETLIDETRIWCRWADRLGVTRLTMLGVLGGMAALDRPQAEAFAIVRPGLDVERELARWRADDPDGLRENFDADDLYGDVRGCFAALRQAGRGVIIAGNQPPQARSALEAMGLDVDAILISDELGAQKPSAEFFGAVADVAGVEPDALAYVGDRLDNDVLPARRAGMRTVLLRRGPWGHLHARTAARRRSPTSSRTRWWHCPVCWPSSSRRDVQDLDGAGDAQHGVVAPASTDDLQADGQAGIGGPLVVAARHGDHRARRHQVEHPRHVGGPVADDLTRAARGGRPLSPPARAPAPSSGTAAHRGRPTRTPTAATARCGRGPGACARPPSSPRRAG